MPRLPPYDYTPTTDREYSLPGEYTVAAWIVLNVEHFRVDEPYREGDPVPNSKDHGRRDYGARVGFWRLLEALDEHDAPATLALNAAVCRHQPDIVTAAVERDWAIMGHGVTNSRRLVEMDREEQRETIEQTREEITAFTGDRPTGWLSPGLLSDFETLDLLAEAGFEYLCDWCVDEKPFAFDNGLLGVPYSLDLNDKGLFGRQGLTGPQYRESILTACETLRNEGRRSGSGRVLPVPIHPYVTGQPFRAPHFATVVSTLASHDDVWLTTGDKIASHYRSQRE